MAYDAADGFSWTPWQDPDTWTVEALSRYQSEPVVEELLIEGLTLEEWYSSGCGGPSYDWTADGHIEIGGTVPSRPVPEAVLQWRTLIYQKAEKYNVPAHFIAGIMSLESGGKNKVCSPAGACGLMQIIPSTAKMLAGRSVSLDELNDPETNVDLGTKLLRQLWDKYNGDPIKIAFSYNAGSPRCGSGCVRDYNDKPKMPCIAACSPNQFGLVGDCYASTHTTVDYGGIVAGYANAALDGDFPLDYEEPLGESGAGGAPVWAKAVLAAGALALVGVGGWLGWQRYQQAR